MSLHDAKDMLPAIVRPFRHNDQEAARALILEGMREHFGFIDESLNPDLDDIAGAYRDGIFLVVERDGVIIGTGALMLEDLGVGRISRMSTAADHRRTGVAASILRRLGDEARMSGCTMLVLSTNSDWHDALAFYRAAGFTETARATHRFGTGVDFALSL